MENRTYYIKDILNGMIIAKVIGNIEEAEMNTALFTIVEVEE